MSEKHAVLSDGEVVGWVSGGEEPELIAAFLNYLLTQKAEEEELLDEILELYRQVNLLFNLSEKLAASLELETVAGTILREASRLIEATGGAVVLSGKEHPHRFLATMGQGIKPLPDLGPRSGVVGAVLVGGRAEIINQARLDPRYIEAMDSIRSLICAPLRLKNETIGAVVLVSQVPVLYTAADLKLLNTLASQAAPSIENALLYERTLQEAQEREERLRRQVQELRIELDEAKQKERVAEITSSEYYQRLRDRADTLRHIIGGTGAP
ncbi:MAG: GAF domain-containing protein [Anaerolineae bacterium]